MQSLLTSWAIAQAFTKDSSPILGPEITNKISGLLRSRSIGALCKVTELVPLEYQEGKPWLALRQIEALFKKNESLNAVSAEERESATWEIYAECEQQCSRTNQRLDALSSGEEHSVWGDLICEMQKDIARTLGDVEPFLKELPRLVRFSSGATATSARRKSGRSTRFRLRPVCSVKAEPLVRLVYDHFDLPNRGFTPCDTDRLTSVYKNYKVNRMITCGPMHNTVLQLGFNSYAVGRLRKYMEINLTDQSSNQLAAFVGSLDGSIATIDLKSASDTVSSSLIALLIPPKWWVILDRMRCRGYIQSRDKGGKIVRAGTYAKFSSMGNGTTFPLETLVFTAACRALGSKLYRVYGDDIAIESSIAPDLIQLLRYLGFQINDEKSFLTGPFRESCGADYYAGKRVTPFYLRRDPMRGGEYCHVVNGMLTHLANVTDGEVVKLAKKVVKRMRLPLVPWCENTERGVFVPFDALVRSKLIRTKMSKRAGTCFQTSTCSGFVQVSGKPKRATRHADFLWQLDRLHDPNSEVSSVVVDPDQILEVKKRITV